MTADRSWLKAVAEVLRAETNDLRELVGIGGADPRTVFIGTSMAGVDMRGQDLRGFVFTDLDATTTLIDEATQLDADALRSSSPGDADRIDGDEPSALIFLCGHPEVLPIPPYPELEGMRLFSSDREAEFLRACQGYLGPRLVVFDSEEPSSGFEVMAGVPGLVVGLDRHLANSGRESGLSVLERSDKAVVTVLMEQAFAGPSQGLVQELARLIGSLISDWSTVKEMLWRYTRPLVAQANAMPPNLHNDAWLRLEERCRAAEVRPHDGVVLAPSGWPNPPAIARHVLGGFKEIRGGDRQGVDQVLLWCDYDRGPVRKREFISIVAKVLLELGWPGLQEVESEPPFYTSMIFGSGFEIPLRVDHRVPDGKQRILSLSNASRFRFSNLREIVICPAVFPEQVVEHLVDDNQLWITPRDLAAFASTSTSLWPLFAAVARRFLPGDQTRRATTIYFELLLREAVERCPPDSLDALTSVFWSTQFADQYRLIPRSFYQSADDWAFDLLARPVRDDSAEGGSAIRLRLTPEGPSVGPVDTGRWPTKR